MRFDWTVNADRLLLRVLTPLLRPLLRANHNWAIAPRDRRPRAVRARRRRRASADGRRGGNRRAAARGAGGAARAVRPAGAPRSRAPGRATRRGAASAAATAARPRPALAGASAAPPRAGPDRERRADRAGSADQSSQSASSTRRPMPVRLPRPSGERAVVVDLDQQPRVLAHERHVDHVAGRQMGVQQRVGDELGDDQLCVGRRLRGQVAELPHPQACLPHRQSVRRQPEGDAARHRTPSLEIDCAGYVIRWRGRPIAGRRAGRRDAAEGSTMMAAMAPTPALPLRDSERPIPPLGFGVFLIPPEETAAACARALAGRLPAHRHGDGLRQRGRASARRCAARPAARRGVRHDQVPEHRARLRRGQARAAMRASSGSTSAAIDLYLIHWPVPTPIATSTRGGRSSSFARRGSCARSASPTSCPRISSG